MLTTEQCPYCGRKPYMQHTSRFHDGKPYIVYCGTLMCVDRFKTHNHETIEEAIDEWNKMCDEAKKVELTPCPHCGKMPDCKNRPEKEYHKFFVVSCSDPKCKCKTVANGMTRVDAIKNWRYAIAKEKEEK